MSWEKIIKQGNCVVSVCNATHCMHNENRKCKLDSITISLPDYGPQCDMFVFQPAPKSKGHGRTNSPRKLENKERMIRGKPKPNPNRKRPAPTRGQQSFIDRATRNLREQERNQ